MRIALILALAALASAQPAADNIVPVFGKLIAVQDHSITIRNEKDTKTILITPDTVIWRGDYVSVEQLQPGDDLAIRAVVSPQSGEATAVDIDANIDRWNGTITRVSGDRIEVALQDHNGRILHKKATLIFWSKTTFMVDNVSTSDLKVGAYLEVIGLVEKNTIRVWRVIGYDAAGLKIGK